jgi:hypothetical protein
MRRSGSDTLGFSQVSTSSSCNIAGMRSWMRAIHWFGVMVTTVNVGIGLPIEPLGLQKLYSPAMERNLPSRPAMRCLNRLAWLFSKFFEAFTIFTVNPEVNMMAACWL